MNQLRQELTAAIALITPATALAVPTAVANEDLVAAGHTYLQATDVNSNAQIQYYTEDTKTTCKLQPGDIRMLHNHVVEIFQSRVLVD